MQEIKIMPAGDSSMLIQFGNEIKVETNEQITSVIRLMKDQHIEGVIDMIPAFCSLLINYDLRMIQYETLEQRMKQLVKLEVSEEANTKRIIEIPVCYGKEFGPDIETVAKRAGMSVEEVIKLHTSNDYLIYMLGFMPGFCFLGGLDERIHTPRLANPRIKIPAGSVGIGGAQTGIYPLDSPGGWQLLGRTPVKVYDAEREEPIIYQAGDYVRFVPVDEVEYKRIQQEVEQGSYQYTICEGGV